MATFSEQAIISLTIAFAHAALLGYLIVKKGVKDFTANLLLGYLLLATGWNLLIFAQVNQMFGRTFSLIENLTFLYPPALMALAIWSFTLSFLNTSLQKRWFYVGSGVFLALIAAIEFLPIRLPGIKLTDGRLFDQQWILFWAGVLFVIFFLLFALRTGILAQQQTYSPRHRNRIQILLLALILLSMGIGFYLSRNPLLQEFGMVVQWLGAPILIFLILNQNLPDINTGLKEFFHFSVINIASLVFYGLVIYWLQDRLKNIPNGQLIVAIAGAISLTLFYLPLRQLTQKLVERILFGHRYNNEQVIKDYIRAINNILFIKDLVSVSLSFIEENLNIKRGAFFLLKSQDEQQYHFSIMSRLNGSLPKTIRIKKNTLLTDQLIDKGYSLSQYTIDVLPEFAQVDKEGVRTLKSMAFEQYVPIKRNNVLIGIIALGPYASGAPYTLTDIELFVTLAVQTAIALENARLFENVRQNLEEITRIKNLMDNVFASIKSGVITASTTDEVLMLNEAAYTILDLPRDIRPGDEISRVMERLQNTALPALFRDVKATQRSYHGYELSPDIGDRGPANLSIDLTPIRDAQKRLKGVALVINDLTEKNRLEAVQDLFRKYLSPAVVDRLPSDPAQLRLGGQRQEVSILFADIRGFSTFSEFQAPEDLITVLNKYLSIAAESILIFEGTLDKFMGDGVMAIFNAPLSQDDHPLRAVKAAAAMQQALCDFHRRVGDHSPQLEFGVGIHVGEAVVGNVGTNSRMDYTAVGDSVNLAKRIQENTPGGKILLSRAAYIRVQERVNAVPYRELVVKGRQEPEQTYELLTIR